MSEDNLSDIMKLAQPIDVGRLFMDAERSKVQWEAKANISFSASGLLENLAAYYEHWCSAMEDKYVLCAYAILSDGTSVFVNTLAPQGTNGIAITGESNGKPCLAVIHQASFQLIFIAEKKEGEKKKVGFILS